MSEPALSVAANEGNLETIRSLLDAGEDLRYVRPHGYTVLIDVMHGRSIVHDTQLLPVLRLLIDRGADLNTESDYGESALSVASRVGRFDAVGMLLEAGADPTPLAWTPLHHAIAIGTVEDVRARIEAGDDLLARDRWHRTPFLLSLQTREVAKAELILTSGGGSVADRGHCETPTLMYPIENDDPDMLRWLLEQGADPNAADQFDQTALLVAAGAGASACARLLVEAGADPSRSCELGSPIQSAANLAIARLLAAAGADFSRINGEVRDELTRRPRAETVACTAEEFQAGRHRVFGTTNPQRMDISYWRAMVKFGGSAYQAKVQFGAEEIEEPAWCFDRFGKSFTELPDGRVIEIAGEHEDFYDPDFCIYNDVVAHHGDGTFDILGYPRDVFPPTDFHTATLVGDFIYILGNLGYPEDRRSGITPLYRLHTQTLAIEPVKTSGKPPGWISEHRARLVGNAIEVTGGKVWRRTFLRKEVYEDNPGRFLLDLGTMVWSQAPG